MQPETAPAPAPAERAPYVGLRPFDRDEGHLFFGRDREAAFICDKIFASRLTLLYAPSGVGKSSVLRTTVLPELEEAGTLPVYFDAWASENPIDGLKDELAKVAAAVGLPSARSGAPTLAELVRLIGSVAGRTVVLILDQFDELLNFHAGQLDAVRGELAALIRSARIDARVLISLRQEFLAALEPFRSEILNLFGSTYLLGPLDGVGLRSAIERPPGELGWTFESALTDVLIADLTAATRKNLGERAKGPEKTGGGEPPATVDLPLLQIVCTRLWEEAKRSGQRAITVELYRKAGGTSAILGGYVSRVMQRFVLDRFLVARLLEYLAPDSGFKNSYSIAELARHCRAKPARIEPILVSLVEDRILRARSYAAETRYELQHDALIGFLKPWRDQVLAQARLLRRAAMVLGAVGGVAVIVAAVVEVLSLAQAFTLRRILDEDVRMPMAQLRDGRLDAAAAVAALDRVGRQFLSRDAREFNDQVANALRQVEGRIPEDYGLPVLEEGAALESGAATYIKVHYSRDRKLDPARFAGRWKAEAQRLMAERGIPVPLRVQLVEEPTYPQRRVTIEVEGEAPLDREVPVCEPPSCALVYEAGQVEKAPSLRKVFLAREGKMGSIRVRKFAAVPYWSLPVWKAAHMQILDPGSALAMLVADHISSEPDRLLTRAAFAYLMARARQRAPVTVAEASAARRDNLHQDLIELLRNSVSLRRLPVVLGALAQYRTGKPKDVAGRVMEDLESRRGEAPERSTARRGGVRLQTIPVDVVDPAFAGAELSLPRQEPVQVTIGARLRERWMVDGEPSPDFAEASKEVLRELFDSHGVEAPSPHLELDGKLGAETFRVEVLGEATVVDLASTGAPETEGAYQASLDRYRKELRALVERHRSDWISAEFVAGQLETMRPSTRAWLLRHYSLTDLVLMLRQVVATGDAPGQDSGTIRNTNWLLRSLSFWSVVEGKAALKKLASHLQETQQASPDYERPQQLRLRWNDASELVVQGIALLDEGDLDGAHDTFNRAVSLDAWAAKQAFLAAYSKTLRRGQWASASVCLGAEPRLTPDERSDLLVLLRSNLTPVDDRYLRLCLFRDQDGTQQQRRDQVKALLAHYPAATWAPADAWMVGLWIDQGNFEGDRGAVDELLTSAFPRLTGDEARAGYQTLVAGCSRAGRSLDCWQRLEALAKLRSDMKITFAGVLSGSARAEDLESAHQILEGAAAGMRPGQDVRCAQARLLGIRAGRLGHALDAQARRKIDEQVAGRKCEPDLVHALATAVFATGHRAEAEEIVKEGLKRSPDDTALLMDRLWFAGEGEQEETARGIALLLRVRARLARSANDARHADFPALSCNAALAEWVVRSGQWETAMRECLYTGHPQGIQLSMLLWSTLAEEAPGDEAHQAAAREILEDALREVELGTLQERLAQGDERAWRERLLEGALGRASWAKLVDVLGSEASFTSSGYDRTRLSREVMLGEALFYRALWNRANGQRAAATEDLDAVLKHHQVDTLEYKLASYLRLRLKDNETTLRDDGAPGAQRGG